MDVFAADRSRIADKGIVCDDRKISDWFGTRSNKKFEKLKIRFLGFVKILKN